MPCSRQYSYCRRSVKGETIHIKGARIELNSTYLPAGVGNLATSLADCVHTVSMNPTSKGVGAAVKQRRVERSIRRGSSVPLMLITSRMMTGFRQTI